MSLGDGIGVGVKIGVGVGPIRLQPLPNASSASTPANQLHLHETLEINGELVIPVIIVSGVNPPLNDFDGGGEPVFGPNLGAEFGGPLAHRCIAHGAGDRLSQAITG